MLTEVETNELQIHFRDGINYAKEDFPKPIDPLTYHEQEGDSCLHIAEIRCDYRAVELLLKTDLNIDEPGDMGATPLYYAITFKQIFGVEY